MAPQAESQAVPARSPAVRAEDGAEQRLHAARPRRRPRRSRLELAPIHVRKARSEIIVADDDHEIGIARPHPAAALFQAPDQPAVVPFHRDARFGQPLLGPARRCTERRPVGRPVSVHAMFGGDDIAPRRERNDGGVNIGGGMVALEGRDDRVRRVPAVEQRQQIAMQPAVQQRVERLGNQQRPLFADVVELEVRSERGKLDEAPVRGSRSAQDPPAGSSPAVGAGIRDSRAGSAGTLMRAKEGCRSRPRRGTRSRRPPPSAHRNPRVRKHSQRET